MKRKITSIIALIHLFTGALCQSPVNMNYTSDYNSLYTGQQGASLITGNYQAVNAPEGGSKSNYYNVWYQNFKEPQGASSVAIGWDNTLYSRLYSFGNWGAWNKYWHSGNLNRNDVDFTAKTISTAGVIKANSKWNEPSIQFSGGTYFRSDGTYLVLQQNGFNDNKTFYIDGFSRILKDQNEVYHAGNLNRLDVGFATQYLTTTRDGIVIQGTGFGNNWSIGKDNTMGLYFYEGGSANQYRMLIKDGGNVLIGKSSQTSTELKFRLDVAGPVRADEIVVNTTGADFVFEPTYKLRPLSELETFIKEHKHLPEIAPAKEMQENGVSAGEMQTKLLQKVEELTLYVIEKDKEIAEQHRMLLELKKEIEILKIENKK